MKKLFLLSALVGISGLANATTINAPSSLIGTGAFEGNDAYSWGISIAVPTGQTITSAEIDFSNIKLTASGNSQNTGVLYTDLLNSKTTGVTTAVDNDAPGDYWATKFTGANISNLGTENFTLNQTISWNIDFSSAELSALNADLISGNGTFNLGFDPDCHFNVGDISFIYTCTPTTPHNTVPDASTSALLMIVGMAGVVIFRRQFAVAKSNA